MKHTYFLENMEWTADGFYYDEEEHRIPLTGQVRVVRNETEWSLDGFLEIQTDPPVRFTNRYSIRPTDKELTLEWESFNPALGTLKGTFEFIGGSIVSYYQSEDETYTGTEILTEKDEKTYYNTGISFRNGKKMSAWTALLTAR